MKYLLASLIVLISLTAIPLAHADTKVYFSPNGDCQQAVVGELKKAHQTIDIAMYSFTSREIAQALLDAKEHHVKIRITLDPGQIKDRYSKCRFLIKKGFDVKFHMGQGLMHDKFAVIDDHTVITGSFNWTVTADKKNSENLLIIKDRQLAQKYSKEFKTLWEHSGEAQLKELKTAE